MKRSRINPMSKKRRAALVENAKVRAEVFERDGRQCRLKHYPGTSCMGRLTYHHLKKASQGGKYTVENGVALCVFHNGWVEDHPNEARSLGLVR